MKFDTFLATVGDWGKFQKMKYTFICLTYMLPPIMVYTYTFTAATPNFRCNNPEIISADDYSVASNQLFDLKYKPTKDQCESEEKLLSLKECQRCYTQPKLGFNQTRNQSNGKLVKCDKYTYEKLYYEKTLVEEVKMI